MSVLQSDLERARAELAAEWGEAVWTHPVDFKVATAGRLLTLSIRRMIGVPDRPLGRIRIEEYPTSLDRDRLIVLPPPRLRVIEGGAT